MIKYLSNKSTLKFENSETSLYSWSKLLRSPLFIYSSDAGKKRAFVLADRTCCHHSGKLQGEEHETAQEHRQARKLPIHTQTVSGCNRGQ